MFPVYDGVSTAVVRETSYVQFSHFYILDNENVVRLTKDDTIFCNLEIKSMMDRIPVIKIENESEIYCSLWGLESNLNKKYQQLYGNQ